MLIPSPTQPSGLVSLSPAVPALRERVPSRASRVKVLLAIAVALFASAHALAQDAEQRMTVLHLSQSVILTGKDADSILKLAGALQSDGLSTSSLTYEVAPETVRGAEEDLTAEALAALDHRAASIADRMHLAVVRFRDVRVGNAETGGRPVPRFTAMAMAAPVAEPGEATVRVTIEAELLLAPPRP